MTAKNVLAKRLYLAVENDFEACLFKAKIKPADPREKRGNPVRQTNLPCERNKNVWVYFSACTVNGSDCSTIPNAVYAMVDSVGQGVRE